MSSFRYRMRGFDTVLGRYVYWASSQIDSTGSDYSNPSNLTDIVLYEVQPPSKGFVTVLYTATGSEGSDFMVSIGVTMTNNQYQVLWGPRGDLQNVPLIDLPEGPGNRTTTEFRVLVGGLGLAAGEKLVFIVFGDVA